MGKIRKSRDYSNPSIPFDQLAIPKTKEDRWWYDYRKNVLEKFLDTSIPFNELPLPGNLGIEHLFYAKRQENDCLAGIAVEGEDPDAYIDAIAVCEVTDDSYFDEEDD